jgi:methyl-accepting chemotaxis protein
VTGVQTCALPISGKEGKAFAVVAQEIRRLSHKSQDTVSASESLSQQSVESITSITNMINDIMDNIDKAHISISIIDQSLNNSLTSFGDQLKK